MPAPSPGSPRHHRTILPLLVLPLIISLGGCAANSFSDHYFPVTNNKTRESSLGFSIRPPSGTGWLEKLHDESLYYLKQTGTREYAMYTKASEIHLAERPLKAREFLQLVKETHERSMDSGNFRNISTSYSPDTGRSPLCVRYSQRYEDHGDRNLRQDQFISVRKNGLMCMHPSTLSEGIDMFYMERYLQSASSASPSFQDEGESFLNSLTFHTSSNHRG